MYSLLPYLIFGSCSATDFTSVRLERWTQTSKFCKFWCWMLNFYASQTPVVAEVPSGTIPSLTHMEQQPEINITSRAMSLPNILNQAGFELLYRICGTLFCHYSWNIFSLQYAAPVRIPTNSTVEDDKVALMMPKQVPSLTQVSPAQTQSTSPSPFSVNQVNLMF